MSEAACNDSGRGRPGRRWRLATRIALGLVLLVVAGFVGLSWYGDPQPPGLRRLLDHGYYRH